MLAAPALGSGAAQFRSTTGRYLKEAQRMSCPLPIGQKRMPATLAA
jgi:hypothetical protein